jgi:hypothetical protein
LRRRDKWSKREGKGKSGGKRKRTRRSPKSRDLSEMSGGERGNRRDFEEEVKGT